MQVGVAHMVHQTQRTVANHLMLVQPSVARMASTCKDWDVVLDILDGEIRRALGTEAWGGGQVHVHKEETNAFYSMAAQSGASGSTGYNAIFQQVRDALPGYVDKMRVLNHDFAMEVRGWGGGDGDGISAAQASLTLYNMCWVYPHHTYVATTYNLETKRDSTWAIAEIVRGAQSRLLPVRLNAFVVITPPPVTGGRLQPPAIMACLADVFAPTDGVDRDTATHRQRGHQDFVSFRFDIVKHNHVSVSTGEPGNTPGVLLHPESLRHPCAVRQQPSGSPGSDAHDRWYLARVGATSSSFGSIPEAVKRALKIGKAIHTRVHH